MSKTLDRDWLGGYPAVLTRALATVTQRFAVPCYVAGGPVRDWLAGRACRDLDLTVGHGAVAFAAAMARELGGTLVPLDTKEGVARVVWQGYELDFSDFREGTTSIEADLARRDFTINALAVAFDPETAGLGVPWRVIDPAGGIADLVARRIRVTHRHAFQADPLRLLRAYRFAAGLDFSLDGETEKLIAGQTALLAATAMERIAYELDLVMASPRAAAVIAMMAANGLLWVPFPELRQGEGVAQPSSHHLDVFAHNHETLRCLEELLVDPGRRFPDHAAAMGVYLATGRRAVWLKWAALFHDLGKPACLRLRDGRITFYNHDREGGRLFAGIGRRLRWSREAVRQVSRFIELHMWPFHLNNANRKTRITPRACLRLVKAVGNELPGLFLLAMADSLAGEGPGKPAGMEEELAALYDRVDRAWQQSIKPVLEQPRLLTGNDLISRFGLASGPLLGRILAGLEAARVAGEVGDRQEAEAWVTTFLATHSAGKSH